jgi:hypothetical protein
LEIREILGVTLCQHSVIGSLEIVLPFSQSLYEGEGLPIVCDLVLSGKGVVSQVDDC